MSVTISLSVKEKISFRLILIASIVLRVFLIIRDSAPFAYDMGRDLLWTKDIAFYRIPTLIGPAASIWGVYFGPLWFYFLSLPLLLTNGNPLSAVYITASAIIFTGFLGYFLFKKYLGKLYALVLAIIILFGATSINISTFAFHANLLPLLTFLLIYFCFLAVIKNPLFISLAFLSSSLMFHADPAPAVVFSFIPIFIFFFFKLYKTKKLIKVLTFSFLGYLIPFAFQILFELRNNFLEIKALVSYFRGENPSLSGQLPFFERILNRLTLFFNFFKESFTGGNDLFAILFLIIFGFALYKFFKTQKDKNLKILLKVVLISFSIIFLIFTVIITVEVKSWYLYGTIVLFAFLIILALYNLKKYKIILPIFLLLYPILNISPFLSKERVDHSRIDPAQLSNQLKAIDMIYQDANNLQFSVYIFTPPIYDQNYQYLFWWQGVRLGRGLPQDFAYLPNQPDYVRNKNVYTKSTNLSDQIYLIIENGQENEFYTRANWLKNFDTYKIVWEKDIDGAVKIQKREK